MSEVVLRCADVSYQRGKQHILQHIDFTVHSGELVTLLGPSGCGKTSLLRLIAGLEQPSSGCIEIAGQDVTALPAAQRPVNMVFQRYALFPHLTVFENVAFALRCRGQKGEALTAAVMALLRQVDLLDQAQQRPDTLSGGQQQRVAIARALANQPQILLLDEPLSALDYALRKRLRLALKDLQAELGITFLMVTHDQEEALSLSDRIVLLDQGRVQQIATPRALYEAPCSRFAAQFVGDINVFTTSITAVTEHQMACDIAGQPIQLNKRSHCVTGDKVDVMIRPEDFQSWTCDELTFGRQYLPGQVTAVIYKGSTVDLQVRLCSGELVHTTEFFDDNDAELLFRVGEAVFLTWERGWERVLSHE